MPSEPQPRWTHLSGRSPQPDDQVALLAAIRDGDSAALAEFYRTTAPRVLGLAVQMLGDRHLAEDLVLDVFERVWHAADRYEPRRGTPLVWLLAIARHRCLDLRRRSRTQWTADRIADLATELGSPDPSPVETAVDRENAAIVRAATQNLPRGQREAIAAAYFGGMSQTEIARTLDVPLGTIKSRLRIGLAALRLALGKHEHGEP